MSQPEKTKAALYVWLAPDLHRQLRIHCAESGQPASVVIRQLLADFLANQAAAAPARQQKGGVA